MRLSSRASSRLSTLPSQSLALQSFKQSFLFRPGLSRSFAKPTPNVDISKDLFGNKEHAQYLQNSLSELEKNKPDLEKFSFFNVDRMAELPFFLEFMEPVVSGGKEFFMTVMDNLHLPFWALTMLACFSIRTILFPLIFLQMKKITKFVVVKAS